jgi:ubiquinone/menaquinone biosynthesis C-methylase UbiE
MSVATNYSAFAGSIPAMYDRHLGSVLFEPYATDTVGRLPQLRGGAVLEIAAGTGIVTQKLAASLPAVVRIVATDLNQPMLDHAASKPSMERVEFRQADALELPFSAAEFDVVVCQFGVMFFPERVAAYRQALRVLKPGGQFILNVWDILSLNPFSEVVSDAMAERFPQDPPQFLARVPYTYNDNAVIRADLAAAGFATVAIEVVAKTSRAASHRDPAIGFTQGSPMRNEIEARDPNGLQAATDAAADALAARFGIGAIEAPMHARVIVASR